MSIILYNPQDGRIIGVTQDSEAKVAAWLANAPAEIAAETEYLLYDESVNSTQAQDVIANAARGKFYVAGGVLYENSQWTGG